MSIPKSSRRRAHEPGRGSRPSNPTRRRGTPRAVLIVASALALAGAACSVSIATASVNRGAAPFGPQSSAIYGPGRAELPFTGPQQSVCSTAALGAGQCLIHVLDTDWGAPAARSITITTPSGLSPAAIKAVYGYTTASTAGAGQTIALVDAYGDPNAAGDLSAFSSQYGLAPECAGAATPPSCFNFTQVNQSGGTSLPATNSSWDLEISLDIEWAHAIAPAASILLVDASTSSLSNLLAAEQYAAAHANYVSNSWGSSEFSGETLDDSYFTQPGVSYFAAAGDSASSVLWPSASPDVTSVGGTSLTFTAGGSLAQEAAWSSSGGGCSRYETASPSQSTGSVSCAGKRATPDVSLDADPNSGVSVYDSVAYGGQSGWWTVGGTSASTVMVAADAAVAGADLNAPYVYASPPNIPLRDITSGSNGHPALIGYDLATGLGSWSYTPGGPTGLTATTGAGGVTLNWSAPTGAPVSRYNIWRGTASGQETTEIASVAAPTTTYPDSTATGAVTYYYEIQAANAAGGVGPFSNEALAAPPSVPPVASFTKACSQASCSFASTSTDAKGTIGSYAWNGGNGVLGSGSTFSDTYTAAGTDNVTLTVTNTAGQSSPPATEQVTCTASSSGYGYFFGRGRTTVSCH
jgi:subtilase family serine protease